MQQCIVKIVYMGTYYNIKIKKCKMICAELPFAKVILKNIYENIWIFFSSSNFFYIVCIQFIYVTLILKRNAKIRKKHFKW